jgi:DNA uptake protein ComE-like DNA-binding protein
VINTNTVQTTFVQTANLETRVITLKNVTANRTIFINLNGIVSVTDVKTDVADATAIFNVKAININTATL